MKKGKLFAPFLTLLAAAITLAIMLVLNYKLKRIAITLLIVVIVFYIIGSLIQKRVLKFIEKNEELARELEAENEGEVIEKDSPEGGASEGDERENVTLNSENEEETSSGFRTRTRQ